MGFPENLNDLIVLNKLSAYKIAKDFEAKNPENKISDEMLRNYIKGTSQPTLDKLLLLAEYFGVSLDELTGHTPPSHTEQETKLLQLFAQYPDDERKRLLDYIEVNLMIIEKEKKVNSISDKRSLFGRKKDD